MSQENCAPELVGQRRPAGPGELGANPAHLAAADATRDRRRGTRCWPRPEVAEQAPRLAWHVPGVSGHMAVASLGLHASPLVGLVSIIPLPPWPRLNGG